MGAESEAKGGKLRTVLRIVAAALFGCLLGTASFTATYAQVPSYFGEDPQTCANCHVMNDQYNSWAKGPHSSFATCNDCHLPHDDLIGKYWTKAEDGFVHGAKFTLGDYPENIVIRDKNLEITNAACIYCHKDLTDELRYTMGIDDQENVSCVRCHSGVGH
jgi:cytochrome c nitrite reductase small subunit